MSEQINIRIKTVSDPKGLQDIKKANEDVSKSQEKVKKSVDDNTKSWKEYASEIPLVGTALRLLANPVALLIGLFTSLAAGVKSVVNEFAGAQVQSARLDAALARSGQLTDAYRESLHDLASQMQETTGVADDKWFEVIRKLTQFGANEGNIGGLTEGVKNLAGIMDGDLTGAANLVARALQGNFEVMSRYGIQAKNVTDLLKELAEKGQGQLEARTKTLTGAWENFTNQLNDLREGIGGLINRTGLLKAGIDFIAGAFQFWVEKIGNVQDRLPGLNNAVDGSAEAMEAAAQATKRNADANAELDTHLASVAQHLKEQNDEIDKRKSRDDRVAAARERAELADIDADQTMSPAEKEFAKLGVTERYAGAAAARENARVAALAAARVGGINELGSLDAQLAREQRELQGRVGSQELQDRRNKRLEEMRRELENTMAAIELGPARSDLQNLATPLEAARAARTGMRAQELGFAYSELDPERLGQRAALLRRAIGDQEYQVTTTAQDRARLGDIGAQREQIGQLRGAGITDFRAFERDKIAEFDTRQVESAFDQFAGRRGAQGRIAGIARQSGDAAAQSVLSGAMNELSVAQAERDALMLQRIRELTEQARQTAEQAKNMRDQ